ncbi:hypothetical protein TrCOL_g13391 [Triparma columacea]|uniref:Uncharacterized protein n=1 Tax=Triparma columacea TaxID=722753 RepID=A0A9W7L7P2_9STRA|nr:hypothetical protein TrCOL_g13391 [Triparma columacea]
MLNDNFLKPFKVLRTTFKALKSSISSQEAHSQGFKNAIDPVMSPLSTTPRTTASPNVMSPKFRRLSGFRMSRTLTEVHWNYGDLKLKSSCGRAEGEIEVCRKCDLEGTWC